ncbi:MAG: WxcM-like domain-containing protein [Bacteroidales bacterium]|nr:WxcM-like domain-containing protein [Bacteroidales bacterium]
MDLSKIHNRAGNITIYRNGLSEPFDVKRIYYLYDVPGGTERGGHAHKKLYQLIIAASGSFDVILDDGRNKKIVELNRPYFGLLILPGIWREIVNFSSGAICLVLASHKYNEDDYIRNYQVYKNYIHDS